MLDDDTKCKTSFVEGAHDSMSAVRSSLNPRTRSRISKILSSTGADCIYLHNIHPFLNHYLVRQAKKRNIKVIQHIHEPHVTDGSAYGTMRSAEIHLFEYLQSRLLKRVDAVVISSSEAYRLFVERYPWFRMRVIRAPLLYQDFARDEIRLSKDRRNIVTFIGPPSKAKGYDKFMELAARANTTQENLEFRVISRVPIHNHSHAHLDNVKVISNPRMSDDEFTTILMESKAVVAPYRSVRQSSTVISSFMCGTPVLATDLPGMREIIIQGQTGLMIPLEASIETWIQGLRYIVDSFESMSKSCRHQFARKYSEGNWVHYIEGLLEVAEGERVLEIGVGDRRVYSDSIGLDARHTNCTDIRADAVRLPFRDHAFDRVFTSHLIEHISHKDIGRTLDEWIRVIRPGGTLEIRCPDLRARALIFAIYPTWQNLKCIYGDQDYEFNFHKCGFSSGLLRNLLKERGMTHCRRTTTAYMGIPFIPDSLHITCRKPLSSKQMSRSNHGVESH